MKTPTPSHEQRRHDRVPLRTTVTFRIGNGPVVVGESINLSAGGMLIATTSPIDVGRPLDLRFVPPLRRTPLRLRGHAVRTATLTNDVLLPHLTGVEFAGMSSKLEQMFDRACRLVRVSLETEAAAAEQDLPDAIVLEPAGHEERRAAERIPAVLRVRFTSGKHFFDTYCTDLSGHGLFIETSDPPPVGSEAQVELDIPGESPIHLSASVVQTRSPDPDRLEAAGVGLKLTGGDLATMHTLASELRHPTLLAGSLRDFATTELVSILTNLEKIGCLRLESEKLEGEIFFGEGTILHARCDAMVGNEASLALLSLREGSFRFEAGAEAPQRTVDMPAIELVLEACRLIDETGAPPGEMG